MAQTGPNSAQNQPAPSTLLPAVNGWQTDFVESLYAQYKADPTSVTPEWLNFFRGFELGLALEATPATAGATTQPPPSPEVAAAAATAQTPSSPEVAAAAATAQRRIIRSPPRPPGRSPRCTRATRR